MIFTSLQGGLLFRGSYASAMVGCDLDPEAVRGFYRLFAEMERVVSLFSMGVNQSSSGWTRSTALSVPISPRGESASRAAGPFRSPVSPTPWAAVKSAAWPRRWPRIWILAPEEGKNIGRQTVLDFIRQTAAADIDGIGRSLKAGTNCGSCRPELAALLSEGAGRCD